MLDGHCMTAIPERLSAALADRYTIERELGAGGMATVFLAEDLKHKRKVALKVLRPELAAVLGAERFVQEITTTASLQHPHILPLFDSGEADGFLFYVMPYVEGETLRDKLNRETQLGIDEAVRITTEVADALDYAHRHGVIHRDIKPENILLHDGRPMVADFGIALAVSAAAGGRMTETGLSLGTPHYMSPEQATAEKDLSARSDIYSLGSVLYEMLTGNPPHTGASVQQIIMKIVTEEAAPVTALRKSVPPNVAGAVAQALEKLPADRQSGAQEFAAQLRGQVPVAGTTRVHPAVTEAKQGRRAIAALGALSTILLVAAIWGWTRPPTELPVIRYQMAIPPAEAVNSGAPVMGRRLALSPDGMQLAYVGAAGPSGGYELWLRNRGQLHAMRIPGTESGRRPFFSPDGTRLGYFTADQSLRAVSLTGEPPTTLNSGDLSASGGAWGSDGYVYAASRGQGPGDGTGIVRVPEGGGGAEVVTTIDTSRGERIHEWPVVLPNQKGALFSVVTSPGLTGRRIAVVDHRTGQHRHLVEGVAAWYAPSGYLVYVTADGTLIATPFDQDRLEITGPGHAVLDGVGVHALGADVTLSASGTLMYMTGTSGFAVQPVWVDRQGRAEPIDPEWTFPSAALYSTTALSPDGTRLVVSQQDESGQHLWVKQLPRGPNAKLTFDGTLNSRASWAPDGRTVVFVSDRSGVNRIWRQVADGSGQAELVAEHPANEGFFSPDGAWFIYRGIAGDRHVYARRTEGDTAVLTVARSERGEEVAPTLSPDGRWIAYVSDESGRDEVYVRPFPDVTRMKQQISAGGGVEPRWSHSGNELFYRSEADEVVSVPILLSGSGFTTGARQVLFSMGDYLPANRYQPTYDVVPGDQRFILTKRVTGDREAGFGELIVVENFLEDLRGRMDP
jgi:serine/threonine-protein kinase